MSTPTAPNPLARLAKQLTHAEDRERYAELIAWFQQLHSQDDLLRLAELLGYLTLIGAELPSALNEGSQVLRSLLQQNATYHRELNDRLSQLPHEIGRGVNVDAMAKQLTESLRQQLVDIGIADLAAFLDDFMPELRETASTLDRIVAPMRDKSREVSGALEHQLRRLWEISDTVRRSAEQLNERVSAWGPRISLTMCTLCFMGGLVCGVVYEHRTQPNIGQTGGQH